MRGAKFANGLITTIDFMEKRRAALVLAGGGARGVAHIGAIEELESQGFEVHAVAGTSMGALVGGMYASGHLEAFKGVDVHAR